MFAQMSKYVRLAIYCVSKGGEFSSDVAELSFALCLPCCVISWVLEMAGKTKSVLLFQQIRGGQFHRVEESISRKMGGNREEEGELLLHGERDVDIL